MIINKLDIADRLELTREAIGIKPIEFGRLFGFTTKHISQTYQSIKKGERGFSVEALITLKINIKKLFGKSLNLNWLLFGEGTMWLEKREEESDNRVGRLEAEMLELRGEQERTNKIIEATHKDMARMKESIGEVLRVIEPFVKKG